MSMKKELTFERHLPTKLLVKEIKGIKKELTMLKKKQEYLEEIFTDEEGKLSEKTLKT